LITGRRFFRGSQGRKRFFFEKKKQKTFYNLFFIAVRWCGLGCLGCRHDQDFREVGFRRLGLRLPHRPTE
jgi:hypothetical protein